MKSTNARVLSLILGLGALTASTTSCKSRTGPRSEKDAAVSDPVTAPSASGPAGATWLASPPPADPDPPGPHGLWAEVFDDAELANPAEAHVDASVDFDWSFGSPVREASNDGFSVRWTGKVQPRYTELYTFITETDDGVRLWIDGQLIIDRWQDQAGEQTGTIQLTAGTPYDLKLEYYDRDHLAVARLSWESGFQAREVIPNERLLPGTPPAAPSWGRDITGAGAAIAHITAPTGSGGSLRVIKDRYRPAAGTNENGSQYDTYNGDLTRTEDWIGYQFFGPRSFSRLVFQEGMHFGDGGWFETLAVQVRQGGVWVTVQNPTVTPAYPGSNHGDNFETYLIDFPAITGDAIRLHGQPGGATPFISVGELRVHGSGASTLDGPVATYGFEEGTGAAAGDSSGHQLDGALSGATWAAGRFGNALAFDGADDRVTVGDTDLLDLTAGMTLSAWVYPTAAPGSAAAIVTKESGGDPVYLLRAGSDQARPAASFTSNGAAQAVAGGSSLPLAAWSHLTATFDGAKLAIYVNGVLVGTHDVAPAIDASASPLRIGASTLAGPHFAGRIDEVRIYGRPLSLAEILADMNTPVVPGSPSNGGPGGGGPPPSPPGLDTLAAYAEWHAELDAVTVTGGDVAARKAEPGTRVDLIGGTAVNASRTVYAPALTLNQGASAGTVLADHVNAMDGSYATRGAYPTGMPALPAVPAVAAGSEELRVPAGTTLSLAATSQYGPVIIEAGATLRLTGGLYQIDRLDLEEGGRLEVTAPVDLRVADRLLGASGNYLGPAPGTTLTAKDLKIQIPSFFTISILGPGQYRALILAPNSKVIVADWFSTEFRGAILAGLIRLSHVSLVFEDGFPGGPAQPCDDGNLCNGLETCDETGTHPGVPPVVDDGNPCTADSCHPTAGVQHVPVTAGTACGIKLVCTFEGACVPRNDPPVVNAGIDSTVTLPASATIAGTVTDDGLPAGANLVTAWTAISGPGVVSFANLAELETTATFTLPGIYVLRLIATDTLLSASDDVTVTVLPPLGSTTTIPATDPIPGETIVNVERTPGGMRIPTQTSILNFIYAPVTTKGSIVKIDTDTGAILAEYWSSPDGQPKDTSRTTVDKNGNVWVSNRAGNSVVHIGLRENGQCVDRNGNGVIDTSTGQNDIRPWSNVGVPGVLQNVTHAGTIISKLPGALADTIRDGDMPASTAPVAARWYNDWTGSSTRPDDWMGYQFSSPVAFSKVMFQEGNHYFDGGWFTSLTLQIRQGGTWVNVPGLAISPSYPGVNDGENHEVYQIDFPAMTGDAIRIFGVPGGSAPFITVAELQVWGVPQATPTGVDTLGGVSTAEDECIIHYVRINSWGARHLSVDRNNDVWAGGTGIAAIQKAGGHFDLIDGTTGVVKRRENAVFMPSPNFTRMGGYGGLIDKNGIVWSARPGDGGLLRWDPAKPLTGPTGGNWHGFAGQMTEAYGLCLDSQNHVWVTAGLGNKVWKLDSAGAVIGTFGHGNHIAQGCVVDRNDHVWVANGRDFTTVAHLKPDGSFVGNVSLGSPSGPSGVAVDSRGKIWASNYQERKLVRIDPQAGPLGPDGVTRIGAVDFRTPDLGGHPYNYSDMTGSTLIGAPPSGTWTLVHDGAVPAAAWGKVAWTSATCGDAALEVRVSSSENGTTFGPEVAARNGEDFDVAPGRYLRVRITFKRGSDGASPLLYDVRIATADYELPVAVNKAPEVNAGPDGTVTQPNAFRLNGSACDDGLPMGTLAIDWQQVSGPVGATIGNATSQAADALFTSEGVYEFRLTGSDSSLSSSDDARVTVSAHPPLETATFTLSSSSPGPLMLGASLTVTASLVDSMAGPMANFPVEVTIAGPHARTVVLLTNASGLATLTYTGEQPGSDQVHAVALGLASTREASLAPITWTMPAPGGGPPLPQLTQGWIASPAHQSTVTGRVPVVLIDSVTLVSGTLDFWPASDPTAVSVLTTTAQGQPGATIATWDTTPLANGPYVLRLVGTNDQGQQRASLVAVTVAGDYKPGRVVLETTDFTVPLAGIPITIGRRYDTLERNKKGDFGRGWALRLANVRLEQDPAHNVTVTLPDGRRSTFYFTPGSMTPPFDFFFRPAYTPAAGVFGRLSSDGCPLIVLSGDRLACFLSGTLEYAPATFKYVDPNGVELTIAATGELKSIRDLHGNLLTFAADGITSSAGNVRVPFERDGQGRITRITDLTGAAYRYEYDAAGDLTRVLLPDDAHHDFTYDAGHRLLTARDPRGNSAITATYHPDGRLATSRDADNNVTQYAYDLTARTTTITAPDLGITTTTHDANGDILSEVDPLGRTTTYQYQGRLRMSETNAAMETTQFEYNASGQETLRRDGAGRPWRTSYNSQGQVTQSLQPDGRRLDVTYGPHHAPTSFTDDMGLLASFTASSQGLPLTVTDQSGATVTFTYDARGNEIARKDRLGRNTSQVLDAMGRPVTAKDLRDGTTTTTYTPLGQVATTTDGVGHTRTFAYDPAGNVTSRIETGSGTTTLEYNARNLLTRQVNFDGTARSFTHDFRGNVLSETNELGHTTFHDYDKAGQLVRTRYPGGDFIAKSYDPLGRLATTTDERGGVTRYEYEPGCGCSDRLTKVTDPLDRVTQHTYDPAGRRVSTIDPAGHTTTFTYDTRGRPRITTYHDGTTRSTAYDDLQRTITETDEAGLATIHRHDAERQLISVTDALGNVTRYEYGPGGDLVRTTDANQHVTEQSYDKAGRQLRRMLPLGMSETFTYDTRGNRLSRTDFRGKVTTYGYDPMNRLLTITPDPSLNEPGVAFLYTPTGQRSRMTDASGVTNYTYDARERLTSKATPAGTLSYTYDSASNVTRIQSSNAEGVDVAYAWDLANQLLSVTDNRVPGGITVASYGLTGQPSTVTHPSGVRASYAYDVRDRVTNLTYTPAMGGTVLASYAYALHSTGRRLSMTEVSGRRASYSYDNGYRLTGEATTGDPTSGGNGTNSYTLDPVGNRLSRASTLSALPSATYSYDANDRLTTDGYETNGNTVTLDGASYAYDFADRLTSKNSGEVTLVYDADGMRSSKTAGGVATNYLVDDLNPTGMSQVIEEIVGGVVQRRYTYGTTLISQAQRNPVGLETSYYGYDGQGNVKFLVDSVGQVTDEYAYDAFGNLLNATGNTLNLHLYGGQYFDPDLGFYSLRARYYDPSRGRFMTPDPAEGSIENPVSLRRYLYANVDPTNRVDPLGLSAATGYGSLAFAVAAGVAALVPVTTHVGWESYTIWRSGAAVALGVQVACVFWTATTGVSDLTLLVAGSTAIAGDPPYPWQYCAKRFSRGRGRGQPREEAKPDTALPLPLPPDPDKCETAIKILTQYERLAQKLGKDLPRNRIEELNRLRDAGQIQIAHLPGSLRELFPGEWSDLTLAAIRALCGKT